MLKRSEGNELLSAIRAVHAGKIYLDPAISSTVTSGLRSDHAAAGDPYDGLTDREREVLLLLAKGHTYQQVGEVLFISPKTVDFHRANILRKLGLTSRTDLTRYAVHSSFLP